MTTAAINTPDNYDAQVAIPQHLLAQLITQGLLHGDQCKCLNATAKQVLWQTMLNCSQRNLISG